MLALVAGRRGHFENRSPVIMAPLPSAVRICSATLGRWSATGLAEVAEPDDKLSDIRNSSPSNPAIRFASCGLLAIQRIVPFGWCFALK